MTLYELDGLPVDGLVATRDYATPEKRPRRTRRRRRCPSCGAWLSRYNRGRNGLCWPCQGPVTPISPDVWAEVYEHVVAALCAPWDLDDVRGVKS